MVVGRDTGRLDEAEVTRATVETVAENITDGIVSPLFFAALGGVPLAFAYRAVNTLDSMVGYKNDRYLAFGWASARFDDLCNYLPARLTAFFLLLAAFLLPGFSARGAAEALMRDARKHPSPNSGYAEATVAGAMGIRLGGCNYYFGQPSWRAYMGEERERLAARHIKKTIAMMYAVTIFFVIFLTNFW
jgi:adenosylcobinamide-phosphate synthase